MPAKLTWEIEPLRLELAYSWSISRNSSDHKQNFIVKVADERHKGLGEVAPNVRYSETPELVESTFARLSGSLPAENIAITELDAWLQTQQLPNSLDFGIRSAYQHFVCSKSRVSVCDALGITQPAKVATSYSIPILPVQELEGFISRYNLTRFKWLKLKVNQDTLVEAVKEVARLTGKPILIDGNEAWTDPEALLRGLNELKNLGVVLVEQPMPARLTAEYACLKPLSPFPLLADESVIDTADFAELQKQFHGVNVKLMKCRTYQNALHLFQEAKRHGMFSMIGCMVETTIGISSAFNLAGLTDYADLDGFMHLKQDPFGWLVEKEGNLYRNQQVQP